MGLFNPKWMNKDEKVALAALYDLSQRKLLLVTRKSPLWSIRVEAASLLKDKVLSQQIFFNLAETAPNNFLRIIAIRRFPDKEVSRKILTDIVIDKIKTYTVSEREKALGSILEQDVLLDIFINCKSDASHFRGIILNRFHATTIAAIQDILTNIAKVEEDTNLKISIIETLIDEDTKNQLLLEISKNDTNPNLRITAAEKITDNALKNRVLEEIIDSEINTNLKMKVAGKLTNSILSNKIYLEIIESKADKDLAEQAVKSLTSQDILKEIAESTDSERYTYSWVDWANSEAAEGADYYAKKIYTLDLRDTARKRLRSLEG